MTEIEEPRRPAWRQSDLYFFVPFALAVCLCLLLADVRTVLTCTALFWIFTLPGFVLCRSFITPNTAALLYGVPVGYSLTGLLVLTVVDVWGWDTKALTVCYALALAACLLVMVQRRAHSKPIPADSALNPPLPVLAALAMGVLIVALVIPLRGAGELTPGGYAYNGLFGHDYILRGVDSVAIGNAVPEDNYFFNGVKSINYYVLWYTLPATAYNALSKRADATDLVAIISLLNVPVFGALLFYTLARAVAAIRATTPDFTRLGVIFAVLLLFSYSYHWIFFLVTHAGPAPSGVGELYRQMGPVATAWYKDLLFQPHSMLAVTQLLVLLRLAADAPTLPRAAGFGLVLGSMVLTDTVMFIVVCLASGLWYLTKANALRHYREALLAAVLVAAIVAWAFATGIFAFSPYSNKIMLSVNRGALLALPLLLLLIFGPLPILGIRGLKLMRQALNEERRLLLLLAVASLIVMLFVTEALEGNVFLRKSLLTLRLPLFVLAGMALYAPTAARIRATALALVILAIPTAVTDVFAASNTADKERTTYVSPQEMQAATWIRQHTDSNAVVQSLIDYPGAFDYSLTICFAQRRAALGLWKMAYQRYPNKDAIRERVQQIETLFSTEDAVTRGALADALHIDYVFVGPRENARFPGVQARFAEDKTHFKEVYDSVAVSIFQTQRSTAGTMTAPQPPEGSRSMPH